jgi:acetyl-CoA carboxylase carboxyltransferase component
LIWIGRLLEKGVTGYGKVEGASFSFAQDFTVFGGVREISDEDYQNHGLAAENEHL